MHFAEKTLEGIRDILVEMINKIREDIYEISTYILKNLSDSLMYVLKVLAQRKQNNIKFPLETKSRVCKCTITRGGIKTVPKFNFFQRFYDCS